MNKKEKVIFHNLNRADSITVDTNIVSCGCHIIMIRNNTSDLYVILKSAMDIF